MTKKFPSYVKAYQYKGGFNKFVYDKLKELCDSSDENQEDETQNQSQEQDQSQSQTPKRSISFTINDGTTAIQGAEVILDGDSENKKTTGSAGGCSFNDVKDGTHSVTVAASGFEDSTESITVSEESNSFTISLSATNQQTTG